MDLLKLIVFEACEDGRVDNFDKADMLNFIEEAVKLQDKKDHDKILSANKKENLRDNDIKQENAILVKLGSGRILFDDKLYRYGIIENKNVTKKAALQHLIDGSIDCGLYSFGHEDNGYEVKKMIEKLTNEWNTSLKSNYEWAQRVAKLKNKCSLMTPKFKSECNNIISKYK